MATAAELQIILTAKDMASNQIEGVGKALGGLGGVGKVATAAVTTVTTAGIALAAGIGASVNAAMNFESAMSAVGAVAGASGTELAALSAKALALGQDTTLAGIGATDAAAAMAQLAAGGVTTTDILEGAARGALLLASAGGIDVARAADIAANAMNGFGLAGTDVTHIADLLAAAANASSADVGDLGESLKFVAPVAHSMGMNIEEVVATLTALGTQGIKGSMAGTALRSMMVSLADPSKESKKLIAELGLEFFDAGGKMKGLGGISEELKTKLAGLTDQQRAQALAQIFGSEALTAATVLYGEGADGIAKYLAQVNVAGSAAANGALRNDNLRGSIEQLKSSWETLTITLGMAFIPAVRGVVDAMTAGVGAILPFIQQYGPVLVAALQQGIGVLMQWGQAVGTAVAAVVGAFQAFVTGQTTLAQFIGGMEIFVTAIRDKLAGLAAAAAPYIGQFFSAIGSAIAAYAPQIAAQFQLWALSFVDWIQTTAIPFLQPRLEAFLAAVSAWITGTALPTIGAAAQQLATALSDWVTTTAIPAVQTQLAAWGESLWGWITGTAVPATLAAAQQLGTALSDWIQTTAIPATQAQLAAWGQSLWGWITGTAVPATTAAAQGLVTALADWVQQAIPALGAQLSSWLSSLGSFLSTVAPQIAANLAPAAQALGTWVGTVGIPALLTHLAAWGQALVAFLATAPVLIAGALAQAGLALGRWIIDIGIPAMQGAWATWGSTLFAGIQSTEAAAEGLMLQFGLAIMQSLLSGIEAGAGALWGWLAGLPGRIAGAVGDLSGVLVSAGASLVQGLISGIESRAGEVVSAAAGLAQAAAAAIAGALQMKSPSKVTAEMGRNVVLGLVEGMDDKQQDAAKKAAEVASSIAKAIADTLGALTALGKLNLGKLPSVVQVSGFLGSLTDFMEKFGTAVGAFEEDVLKQASGFADAAGKAVDLVKNAVDGLGAIGKFARPLDRAVSDFLGSLTDFMEKFSTAASGFEEDVLAQATTFAEAAGKVGASVGNALKGLQELASADWAKSSPTGGAMGWFTHLTASLVANFARASTLFAEDALANASAFADAAGKVGGAVGNALTGLKALAGADWANSSPSGSAMGWLTHLIASLTQNFAAAAREFADDALAQASAFAESAGKVMAVIGPAIAGLGAINALVTPPRQAVDNLLAGIRYIVGKFGEMASAMETEGVAKLGAFSEAAAKALGAAKTGVELFKEFDKLVIPSKEAIDNLVIAIHHVVDRFDEMARSLATEGIAKLQAFAAAAGQALAAAKAGADLFKEMEKLAVPSREAINNLLEGIKAVVVQMGAIADQIGTGGIQKAQDFATKSLAVFTTFKSALDLLGSLEDFKALPLDAVNALIDGMKKALEKTGELQGAANAFLQQADTFEGTMRQAAAKLAAGLALGGAVPSTTTTTTTTTSGFDFRGDKIGKRAAGGPVAAGSAYLVGERGPELFVPNVGGSIAPNGRGGGTVVNVINPILLGRETQVAASIASIVTNAQNRQIGYSIG